MPARHERHPLEHPCRRITRTVASNERFPVNRRGQVLYRLKHPFRDGITHIVPRPIEFLARLTSLVPRPCACLTRCHGTLAPISLAWGVDNRTAAVRLINETPAATRPDLRVCGGDVNVYLTFAACLAAASTGSSTGPIRGRSPRATSTSGA